MSKFINSDEKYINNYCNNDKLKSYLNENYSKMSSVISNEFFTTFWMLTLDSIYFPSKLYLEKIEEVKVIPTLIHRKKRKVNQLEPTNVAKKIKGKSRKPRYYLPTLKTKKTNNSKKFKKPPMNPTWPNSKSNTSKTSPRTIKMHHWPSNSLLSSSRKYPLAHSDLPAAAHDARPRVGPLLHEDHNGGHQGQQTELRQEHQAAHLHH
jgi:hypothetical protein